jgi:oxygen-independent coproporphyrinogen III oxidase
MAGIYIHIPFCKQACHYCNFHFSTSLRYKDDVVKAIVEEINIRKNYLQGEIVKTIYFGGGTPSLLSFSDLNQIMHKINSDFQVIQDAEITLEINPDDITEEKLMQWKVSGINRLSIGVQSFFEEELKWMNRAHNAEQAILNLQLAKTQFANITIDLIYGSPLLSDDMWKQNVEKAIALDILHLSCYALTVEEKTPLHKNIALHKTPDVDNEKQARQFLLLMQWLREAGYEHYEVSNFAKPGFRSRHNSSYWKGDTYLGLGPSAHSFNGIERQWNVANNQKYVSAIADGASFFEKEVLSERDQLNEHIMISLRTKEGLDVLDVEKKWGKEKADLIEKQLKTYILKNEVHKNDSIYSLSDEGFLKADGIAGSLFI